MRLRITGSWRLRSLLCRLCTTTLLVDVGCNDAALVAVLPVNHHRRQTHNGILFIMMNYSAFKKNGSKWSLSGPGRRPFLAANWLQLQEKNDRRSLSATRLPIKSSETNFIIKHLKETKKLAGKAAHEHCHVA
jgi:hypothetical protein